MKKSKKKPSAEHGNAEASNTAAEPSRNIVAVKIGAQAPMFNLDEVMRQMREANRYYNARIAIERDRRDEVRAVEIRRGLFDAMECVRRAEGAKDAVLERVNAAKVEGRSRRLPRELSAEFSAAKKALSEARKSFYALRAAMKEEIKNVSKELQEATEKLADLKKLTAGGARRKDKQLDADLRAAEMAVVDAREALANTDTVAGEIERINARAKTRNLEAYEQANIHWGTKLLVIAASDDACSIPLWSYGRPNNPAFRRWDGEGSLGIQLQPPVSMSDVLSGCSTQIRILANEFSEAAKARVERKRKRLGDPTWQPRQGRDTADLRTVWMRIGSADREPVWTKVPVVLSRYAQHLKQSGHRLPQNGVVRMVTLKRSMHADEAVWSVSMTIELPAGTSVSHESCGSGGVALHLGWRRKGDMLRAAVVLGEDGSREEIFVPASVERGFAYAEELRSINDKYTDIIRPILAAALKDRAALPPGDDGALPERIAADVKSMHAWKSAPRLVMFVRRWIKAGAPGGDAPCDQAAMFLERCHPSLRAMIHGGNTLLSAAQAWSFQHRHLWHTETGVRWKALRRRDDHYKAIAAQYARKYDVLVVDDTNRSKLAKQPEVRIEGEAAEHGEGGTATDVGRTVPDKMKDAAQRNRFAASVSSLEAAFKNAFRARQGRTIEVMANNETITCSACKRTMTGNFVVLVVTCEHCGAVHDQDDNAAKNKLASAADPSRVVAGVPLKSAT